jgi:hypothetical protein
VVVLKMELKKKKTLVDFSLNLKLPNGDLIHLRGRRSLEEEEVELKKTRDFNNETTWWQEGRVYPALVVEYHGDLQTLVVLEVLDELGQGQVGLDDEPVPQCPADAVVDLRNTKHV